MNLRSLMLGGLLAGTIATAVQSEPAFVATVGADARITASEVEATASPAFAEQRANYKSELRQLEARRARDYHELLARELERLLDRRALELEAVARRKSVETVAADIKVATVTDAEIRGFYAANKTRIGEPYIQAEREIKDYLASQHKERATRVFYDELRRRYDIRSQLPPHREQIAATGASLGSPDAPVTIIEFADFQCPYCGQSSSMLKSMLSKHGDRIRLVFRHLPLADIHPDAMSAARAAVCADRQGKFWPMHDAMFDDQNALNPAALESTARRLGLSKDQYAACVDDEAVTRLIDADANAAFELGISSTPSFLINGRLLVGSAPETEFNALIDDELQHASSERRINQSAE